MSNEDGHGWNHPQCYKCWFKKWGFSREPVRLKQPRNELCCYCGSATANGIYIRAKPASLEVPYCRDTWNAAPAFFPDPPGAKP